MLEFIKEILIVFVRILTILPLLLFTTLFMGKRAIGEIPVFDFLIVIILGAVVIYFERLRMKLKGIEKERIPFTEFVLNC